MFKICLYMIYKNFSSFVFVVVCQKPIPRCIFQENKNFILIGLCNIVILCICYCKLFKKCAYTSLSLLVLQGFVYFEIGVNEEGINSSTFLKQTLILIYGCDITGIQRKSLLRLLADHCSNNDEKLQLLLLSSRSGKEQYAKEIIEGQPSLLDLLNKFPSSQPPLDHLFDILPPLAPRMYSIACSNQELPNEVHIAFSVVRYQTMYGEKKGVATTWLDQYCNSDSHNKVRIGTYVRSGGDFKHPLLLQSPIIMIGPGTGVAPFRGFLQQRRAMKKAGSTQCGESWLFFGCRREDEDYLYRSDFEQFVADGTLNHLVCAFSRAQKEKVYVQHKMMEVGQQLADCIIKKGGYIFVCGDGARMAKDVHACLENIFQKYADMTEQEASSALAQLTKTKRYVRDIWS
eukprot:TRINITY_DN5522_c0_g1_i6.p2 TRINITY_DN5522_c0_g1~~TRINITY_DN5522_c0_g1_i6.p2  ORF type:complete len:402 (-),score=34.19 TRINITY_DN5522_c0_g1_i6:413-1618(-)